MKGGDALDRGEEFIVIGRWFWRSRRSWWHLIFIYFCKTWTGWRRSLTLRSSDTFSWQQEAGVEYVNCIEVLKSSSVRDGEQYSWNRFILSLSKIDTERMRKKGEKWVVFIFHAYWRNTNIKTGFCVVIFVFSVWGRPSRMSST